MDKKSGLLLLLLLLVNQLFSQAGDRLYLSGNSFVLNIQSRVNNFTDEKKGKFTVRDYYEYTDPSIVGQFKLPSYNYLIAIPPNSQPQISVVGKDESTTNFIIPKINPKLKRNNDSSLSLVEVDMIEGSIQNEPLLVVKGYTWYRDFYCAIIQLNTHSYNPGNSTLTEFQNIKIRFTFSENYNFMEDSPIQIKSEIDKELKTLIYNWEIAEQFRTKPNYSLSDSTYDWINFNNMYLKLSVGIDGIYRISRIDLENFGISTSSINPKTFQLFNKGEEISIYVKGEGDNIFDDNDYIEFYGERNYSDKDYRQINPANEDYNEYLNRYTDSSYYFLTWNLMEGKRIPIQNINLAATDTVNFYSCFTHVESNTMFQNQSNDDIANQKPDWKNNKTWYWQWIFTSPRSFNFTATDIFPDKPVNVFFKLVSGGSNVALNSHNLALKLNGSTVDSQVVNRFQQVLLNGNISSNLLNTGSNQIIMLMVLQLIFSELIGMILSILGI
jgi:hypothetical protein